MINNNNDIEYSNINLLLIFFLYLIFFFFLKAEDKLNRAKEAYEVINNELIDYLPKPLNNRVSYLEPSFDALILSQLSFAEQSFNVLNELQNKFLIAGANLDSLDNLTEKSNYALSELKQLGICNFHQ